MAVTRGRQFFQNPGPTNIPDSVLRAYNVDRIEFGREYIIPKPFDPRVLIWQASAVAQAAMDSGVAQAPVDIRQYRHVKEAALQAHRTQWRGLSKLFLTNPTALDHEAFRTGFGPRPNAVPATSLFP